MNIFDPLTAAALYDRHSDKLRREIGTQNGGGSRGLGDLIDRRWIARAIEVWENEGGQCAEERKRRLVAVDTAQLTQ